MSQTWGDIQESFYRRENSPKECTGVQWTRKIIRIIWNYILQTWTRRNQKLHEDPQNTPPHRQHLENLIKIMYVKHQKNTEIFRGLYKHNLVTLLNKRTKYLQKWLKLAEPIEHLLKVKRKRQGGRDIRKYLKMATHPPDDNPTQDRTPTQGKG